MSANTQLPPQQLQNAQQLPQDGQLLQEIDAYVDAVWDDVLADLSKLVAINSVGDPATSRPGAPFGEGPAQALNTVLEIAERLGFDTHNCEGYIGYADVPGGADMVSADATGAAGDTATAAAAGAGAADTGAATTSPKQIACIAHLDIVPAGSGWRYDPFSMVVEDGCIVGRGVVDDKGPAVVALYAAKFFIDKIINKGAVLPYSLRCILGCNEETGMADVAYYLAHYPEPDFLFTPDADFPAIYGEKGLFHANISFAPGAIGQTIKAISGGTVTNAVPNFAEATLRVRLEDLPACENISLSAVGDGVALAQDGLTPSTDGVAPIEDGLVRIQAHGVSAHASKPEGGTNAIKILIDYLVDNGLYSPAEAAFLRFEQKLLSSTDGSSLGLATEDEHFGPLTMVGGLLTQSGTALTQSIDIRFPTSTTADAIEKRINEVLRDYNNEVLRNHNAQLEADASATPETGASAKLEVTTAMTPYLVDPNSEPVQALVSSYNEITGKDDKPCTIGGATYARHFKRGISFGPCIEDMPRPNWVNSEHSPNEGIPEQALKDALKIYILGIARLCRISNL